MFYFSILNIPAVYRSKLQSIFLLGIVPTTDIKKFGMDAILAKFVQEVNVLSSVGFNIDCDGKKINIKGGLAAIVADTLAAHQILGFKEGVGFARQKCRTCMCTSPEINNKYRESEFELRTMEKHTTIHCKNIAETTVLTGVNRKSVILDINNFDIFSGTPHDLMHILLEGCLPYTIKAMLQYFLNKKTLLLDNLNASIQYFDYSYLDQATKPSQISRNHLLPSGCLRQSASQMWTLSRLLPLFLGNHINHSDSVWQCFITLLQITSFLLSRRISKPGVYFLILMIGNYLKLFKDCFPDKNIIPKQHYLLHLPASTLKLGPNINYWTMRFEAKHSYFKKLANCANFKNVSKYMALRHQKHFCMELLGNLKSFSKDVKFGPMCPLNQKHIPGFQTLLPVSVDLQTVKKCNWINVDGQKFKPNCFVYIGLKNELPVFGKVLTLLSKELKPFMYVAIFETTGIENTINAYVLQPKDKFNLIAFSKVLHGEPLAAYTFMSNTVIPIKTNLH